MTHWRRGAFFVAATLLLGVVILVAASRPHKVAYGFTYSTMYAQYLGLDPITSFEEILHDLHFSFVRLPVYWDRYEPINDLWNDQELQSLLDIAQREHVSVILAIGQKVPRWPECFAPSWTKGYDEKTYNEEFLAFTQHIISTFGNHPAVKRWQIENESYFPFGDCKNISSALIRSEKELVRASTPSIPIQTTVSGEQGVGINKAPFADIIGFSLYRTVSAPPLSRFVFPHPPLFYRVQSWLVALAGKRAVISELQAEPWGLQEFDLTKSASLQAAANAFTPDDLSRQLVFARQTGMREISLWGVEWWLALAKHGQGQLWEAAKILFE